MKNIWTPKDIEAGMLIIRESSPKKSTNLSFATTVTYKIGFGHFGEKGKSEKGYDTDQQYCKIAVFTDGLVYPVGFTKQDLCDALNKDEIGYRPLTIDEAISLLEHSKSQLFY